jgi:hypothetical protein
LCQHCGGHEETTVSSTAKHRAEPQPKPAGRRRFTPMLVAIGGLIVVTGVVAGGAGILGALQL